MRTTGDESQDEAWFEALYLDTVDDLRRFVARRVTADAVDDAVSEIFLTAWRRQQDYRHDEARLWLFTVARGVVANLLRGDRRRAVLQHRAVANATFGPAQPDNASTLESEVLAALGALSDQDQEVLRLVAWDALTIAEAAQVSQCSQAALRVRLFRARRRLAALLPQNPFGQDQTRTDKEGEHDRAK